MTPPKSEGSRFRQTAVRVLAVQIVTLLILWWLQATFAS